MNLICDNQVQRTLEVRCTFLPFQIPHLPPHVDFARHRRRDERGAVFAEPTDSFLDLRDERVQFGCLIVNVMQYSVSFLRRWENYWEFHKVGR